MKKSDNLKRAFLTRGLKISNNPAIEAVLKLKASLSQTETELPITNLKKAAEAQSEMAHEALNLLFQQAQGLPPPRSYTAPTYTPVVGGDPEAMRAYVKLVCDHIENLNSLLETHRELLLPISRNRFNWPMRISTKMFFGDNPDKLLLDLQVGKSTIANDPAARFDLTKKFGKAAWNLIKRIEHCRTTPKKWLTFELALSNTHCSWAKDARKLPAFTRQASRDEQIQWLAVVEKVLKDDFRDPELASDYKLLVPAPSHQGRWKAIFFDKIRGVFDSLWCLHSRKQKKSS